jgi:hypothetical protein
MRICGGRLAGLAWVLLALSLVSATPGLSLVTPLTLTTFLDGREGAAITAPCRCGQSRCSSRCRRCRRCKGSSKGVQIGRDRGCKSRRNAGFRAKGRGFEPHLPPARGLQSVPLARTQGKAADMRKWWQSKRPTCWRAPALRRHGPGGPTPLQSSYSRPTRKSG